MKHRLTALFLTLTLILATMPLSYAVMAYPGAATAKPSTQALMVNGELVDCDRYNINGENYFKLRDLAYILSGTSAQFEVGYADGVVTVTKRAPYSPVGTEMGGRGTEDKTATLSTDKIMLDGEETALTAYKIDGSNYFRLRDVGTAINFNVDYDDVTATVVVRTYSQELVDAPYRYDGITIVTKSKILNNPAPKAEFVDFTDPDMPTNIMYSVLKTLRWAHEGDYFYCYFSVPELPEGFAVEICADVEYTTQFDKEHMTGIRYELEKLPSGDSQATGWGTFFTADDYCIIFDGMVNLKRNLLDMPKDTSLPSDEVTELYFRIAVEYMYGEKADTGYVFPELRSDTVSILTPSTSGTEIYSYPNAVPCEEALSLWK